jgi:two-component system, LytTR family, response regulator
MIKIAQQNSSSFLLPSCKGIEIINTANLIRIEAISNYSKLFFADGSTVVVAKVLKWFVEKLPAAQFLRSHRKHIVNIHFIHKYCNGKIELCNAQVIDVSKRKRIEFLKGLHAHAA